MAEGGGFELSLPFTEHYLFENCKCFLQIYLATLDAEIWIVHLASPERNSNPMVRFGWTGLQVYIAIQARPRT